MDMDMDMDVDMDMDMDIDVYHRPNLELACNVGCRLFILNHTQVPAIVTIKERESMFAEMLKHTGVAKGASSGTEFYP